jgi:hypothetical protein
VPLNIWLIKIYVFFSIKNKVISYKLIFYISASFVKNRSLDSIGSNRNSSIKHFEESLNQIVEYIKIVKSNYKISIRDD